MIIQPKAMSVSRVRQRRPLQLTTVALLVGCAGRPSAPAPPAPSPVPSPPIASASSTSAVLPPSAKAGPDGGAQERAVREDESLVAQRALGDALVDRYVFRHVLVGALRYPPTRITWVFFQGNTTAKLQTFCQSGESPQLGLKLKDGLENDDTRWRSPAMIEYVGSKTDGVYRLGRRPIAADDSPKVPAPGSREASPYCQRLPASLDLRCRLASIDVLRSGAKLIPGRRKPDDSMTAAQWVPATRERLKALECEVTTTQESEHSWSELATWHFVFAHGKDGSPGVEWAHENSDMTVQAGAYRWMPPSP